MALMLKLIARGQFGDLRFGGSGAAIGNFMNNGGNNEIILTDAAMSFKRKWCKL